MIYKESAMRVRQNLGELLNKVYYRHDTIIITKAEKPVAAIIDIELFEKIRSMKTEFERLSAQFVHAYRDIEQATAESEIKEVITANNKSRKKKIKENL
jgi:prevent-host-death family protein